MEQALFIILQRAAISALIDDRCYPNERPQSSNLPCITYHKSAGNYDYAMSGATGLVESRYQIDCWAKDENSKSGYLIAKEIAAAVKSVVSPIGSTFFETVAGIQVQGIFIRQENDNRADGASGVSKFSRVFLDVTIVYHE